MAGGSFLEISMFTIGTVGVIGNASSLWYNCRRKGFPRRLYVVLNIIDFSVCILGIVAIGILLKVLPNVKDRIMAVNYYALANQSSALWTCIMSGTRLLAMSRPFYQINKTLFWTISTAILGFSLIPQTVIQNLNDKDVNDIDIMNIKDGLALNTFQMRNIWIYFGCTSGLIAVNLVITVWTGILLNQKSEVSAETDRHRRNAAVTVVLLCVVFLLTNVSGLVVCAIIIEKETVFTGGWFDAWLLFMVINATLNPVVILRRKLVDLCCRVRISRISTIVTTQ
eukprot:sb/3467862/